MCGIMGIHFKNPRDKGISQERLEALVNELLLGIEHRGGDATGLLTVSAKGVPNLVKADVRASVFVNFRDPIPRRVRTILGHTRLATQGSPTNLDNNHPVQYGSCFAIHNGHIANDSELFVEHSLGRNAEVDSEIIPALFEKYGLDKAHLALQELEGGFATAVVNPDKYPNMTVLAKGYSSPCEVLDTKHAVIWASEWRVIQDACEAVLGFKPALSKIKTMHEGDVILMEGDTVEWLGFEPKKRVYKPTKTESSWSYSNDGILDDLCSSCGCKRLHHGAGSDFSGSCKYVHKVKDLQGEEYDFPCRCEAFTYRKADPLGSAHTWEYCDGCGRSFYLGDLVQVGQKYLCPNTCAKDPAVAGTVEELTWTLRKRAEDVLIQQLALAAELDVDEGSAKPLGERANAMNQHACEMASEKTGMAVSYIDWLVNSCSTDLADKDETGFLAEARQTAGKAYFRAWSDLDLEINEIEETNDWIVHESDNACDTELDEIEGEVIDANDECGVITIHDYPSRNKRREEVTA